MTKFLNSKGKTPLLLILYILSMPFLSFLLRAGKILDPPQATITGTVTQYTGVPLAGVNIVVESKYKGAISDLDGTYQIEANADDVLIFSMVGYKTQIIQINGRDEISIQMEEDVTALEEVVLNAGYYTISDKKSTGSIAKVKANIFDKQPVNNPLAAMQGHVAGVNIVQTTGLPGGGFNIEIRGRNFLNGVSDPLFIVDGVPFNSQSLGASRVSGQIMGGSISPLNAIDPNDIESIEVLKDGDATAIYGSRGANGVVLITTKKGQSGKTRVEAHVSTTMGQVSHFLDLMNTNQYLEVRREGIANDGYGDLLNDPNYDFFWPDVKLWENERYTNWQEELIGGTAFRNNYKLSLSGGNDLTQFLISSSFQNETTVFPGDSKYQKANIRSNVNHQSENRRFSINLSLGYTNENNTMPTVDFSTKAYTLEPNAPKIYDEEGNINWENNTWDNPLASLDETYNAEINTLFANTLVSYKLTTNLKFQSNIGFSDYRLDSYRSMPSSARNPGLGVTPQNYSNHTINNARRTSWIVEPQLNYKKGWDLWELDVLVGTTFQEEVSNQLVQRGLGYPNDGLINNLTAAETIEIFSDTDGEYKYNALFGRVHLEFMDKYIINLTGRRDGSSRFGPGRQFGNFGALGAAWIFSNEGFFKENAALSFGKIRASYGTTGSDNIGDYRFLDTYSVTGNNYNNISLLEPTGVFNPLFGWEANRKMEVALELGWLKDRIFINTSYYKNKSSNQLIGIPLAATTGFSELTGNFDAEVENTGWEFDLRTINIQSNKLNWKTTFNLTVPRNKLVSFEGLETSTFSNRYVVGEPLTIAKLYHSLGVDPQTGEYTFEDYNGDTDITSTEDRQWIEDLAPTYYGGLGNSISFGSWSMDMLFQFKKQMAYNTLRFVATPGFKGNTPESLYDRWTQTGDNAPIQKSAGGLAGGQDLGALQRDSDAAISDASYVRLRNISLNYRVPSAHSDLDFQVYLQGQNLWTWTNYDGPDPEQPASTRLPPLRQMTLGFKISF
ncbi:SusC/RagA family TonB-linked outer membrane protein [Euzebyella marina]|uniref:SusC/RagA family TonB-linked outer membrane protein n=1 Tax=Euzebyella marina TaxID=1761453 RepID=A0A3G2L5M5_9FLAO|nr:SusC/RagA family TonB-linked outer membrane protein [Euzebyella marina]AYN67528.1 SusC/RagA family TonB-linked outer membrane protein [Euzebyella marina]